MAEILAGEADVTRLLGHVDAHHASHQRVDVATRPEGVALGIVDGLLAAEDEEEEELGKAVAEACHAPGAQAIEPTEARNLEADALDQLVEHEGMLRLLDDLVVGVTELGGV